jgi:hypothetical protein
MDILIGCLALIIGFFIFLFLLKIWFVALIFLIILAIFAKGSNYIKKTPEGKEFKGKPGTVYKECVYCNTKAERTARFCPNCGKSFE